MKNPDFKKVLKEGENRYQFVSAVAKRANQVNEDEYLKAKCGDENVVSYALEEFVSGKLEMNSADDGVIDTIADGVIDTVSVED